MVLLPPGQEDARSLAVTPAQAWLTSHGADGSSHRAGMSPQRTRNLEREKAIRDKQRSPLPSSPQSMRRRAGARPSTVPTAAYATATLSGTSRSNEIDPSQVGPFATGPLGTGPFARTASARGGVLPPTAIQVEARKAAARVWPKSGVPMASLIAPVVDDFLAMQKQDRQWQKEHEEACKASAPQARPCGRRSSPSARTRCPCRKNARTPRR